MDSLWRQTGNHEQEVAGWPRKDGPLQPCALSAALKERQGSRGILNISNNTRKARSRRLSQKLEADGCAGAAAEQEVHLI